MLYLYDAEKGGTFFDRLLVDWQVLQEHLPIDRPVSLPDAILTASDAGRLLGLSGALLPEIIEVVLLRARRNGAHWELGLGDLLAFHRQYVISTEYYQRHGLTHGDRWLGPFGADGEIVTRHFCIWPREAAEAQHRPPYAHMS